MPHLLALLAGIIMGLMADSFGDCVQGTCVIVLAYFAGLVHMEKQLKDKQ